METVHLNDDGMMILHEHTVDPHQIDYYFQVRLKEVVTGDMEVTPVIHMNGAVITDSVPAMSMESTMADLGLRASIFRAEKGMFLNVVPSKIASYSDYELVIGGDKVTVWYTRAEITAKIDAYNAREIQLCRSSAETPMTGCSTNHFMNR